MPCQAVQMWSLSGLVAAFLDLVIAYLLLCASAVAYLASKFMGFFGMNLPCPCDGIFINIHCKSFCLNRLLVDFPTQRVSEIQLSVKEKFPFSDCSSGKNRISCVVGDNYGNGVLELEGEASCSSVSDARKSGDVVRKELGSKAEKYDMKGKGVINHRPRTRLRQRRKGGGGLGKYSSVSSYDPPLHEGDLVVEPCSHCSTDKEGNGLIGDNSLPGENDAEVHNLEYDDKAPTETEMMQRAVTGFEMNHSLDEDVPVKKNILSVEELQNNPQGLQSFSGDEKSTIRLLEQTLEEERNARAALYVELEKERSAAASAADEAMAMILRLQEEKASIEMEARQYQRMIEEKSVYDAEEMDILKEIILRREKEKHFLEKEVEAYRLIVSAGDEQLAGDGSDKSYARQIFDLPLDPNDDPVMILRRLAASTDKKTVENKCSEDKPNSKLPFGNGTPAEFQDETSGFKKQGDSDEQSVQMSVGDSVENMDLQEKEMISVYKNLQLTSMGLQECNKTIPLDAKGLEQIQETNLGRELEEKIIVTCYGMRTGDPCRDPSLKQQPKDADLGLSNLRGPVLDKDSCLYDVHIIGDKSNIRSDTSVDRSERNSAPSEASLTKSGNVTTDRQSSSSGLDTDVDVKRSSSEITSGLPPVGPKSSSLISELRRNSMSAMDSEMLKIDSEIGRLRERLKRVQEGREKLGLSVEKQEKESTQLKLLEDIARQVREIRQLTEPRKASRQASLPIPNSKADLSYLLLSCLNTLVLELYNSYQRSVVTGLRPRKGGAEVFLQHSREGPKDDSLLFSLQTTSTIQNHPRRYEMLLAKDSISPVANNPISFRPNAVSDRRKTEEQF
ncbi:putative myosin-binding protein 5 [Sesamum alatum]|uniref:Myosin-binding protein 5 n=1 Tax=Sesamum alatum TaxID=300844 RepID=A0AAE2CK95_9LAMI|nr:putative myosin-binding protein 5 [Sesamum alatum]